jgi:hypothetical protein
MASTIRKAIVRPSLRPDYPGIWAAGKYFSAPGPHTYPPEPGRALSSEEEAAFKRDALSGLFAVEFIDGPDEATEAERAKRDQDLAAERTALLRAGKRKLVPGLQEWAKRLPLVDLREFVEKAPDLPDADEPAKGQRGAPFAK